MDRATAIPPSWEGFEVAPGELVTVESGPACNWCIDEVTPEKR